LWIGLIFVIKYVKSYFPNKEIGVLILIGRQAKELIREANFYRKITEEYLARSQFDDIITLPNNIQIKKPKEWE